MTLESVRGDLRSSSEELVFGKNRQCKSFIPKKKRKTETKTK